MDVGGAVGVFGKLPARRDYVQHGVEPRLLRTFDPWLQSAVAESRRALGDAWLDHWLVSPIWRFWLGARIVGVPVLGTMMPSVDGIGRYFPLCVLGAFDAPIPPPEIDEQAEWFAAVESLLLETLGETATYEALIAGLETLPPPHLSPQSSPVPEQGRTQVQSAFAALRGEAARDVYDRCTCWWVPSSDGVRPPRAMLWPGLPPPVEYAAMVAPNRDDGFSPAPGETSAEALGEAP